MTDDDPFLSPGDAGPTVIRPTPGGRRAPGAHPRPEAAPAATPGGAPAWLGELASARASNPLVGCATALLAVAGELRGVPSHADPEGLRERLIRQVRAFETCARARGLTDPVVLPARYVLCALVDEAVLNTPWGGESIWSKQGLLISFHKEAWGGEKFFSALDRLLTYPSGNLDLLELMYLCLALGFEGRYRLREGGRDELERVREHLFQTIRNVRGDPERELSPHWQGVKEQRDPLIHNVPLWVLSAVAGILLLGLFSAFTFALNSASDPVYLSLGDLDRGLPVWTRPSRPPPPRPEPLGETLCTLLAGDSAAGRLEVNCPPQGQQVLIISGDGLFASARATPIQTYVPLLERIAQALAHLPGQVLVTGHTDSAPIKSLRFPSNWHLSKARAVGVASLLSKITGEPARFTAEGRADSDPLVPENPRDARNRRVEITLAPAHAAASIP